MRIQHNIMAMNAYRNYNANTSALSKNLEKLSSGYKINRAGDDAAGLAISEKMRAQITGLDAAQKNVKDGISLVKTAEGAMQEVQDMLNRMVYLAEQSANGTYDNEVDRANLQKEVDQLRSEIDRIADSANFNGINLLDGSMEKGAVRGAEYTKVDSDEILNLINKTIGTTQGAIDRGETVLEKDGADAQKASFSVKLDNLNAVGDDELTLKVGDKEFKVNVTKDMTGADIAKAFAEKYGDKFGMTDNANRSQDFTLKADGNSLHFTAVDTKDFNPPAEVTFSLKDTGMKPGDPVTVNETEITLKANPYTTSTGVATVSTTDTLFTKDNLKITPNAAINASDVLAFADAEGLTGDVSVKIEKGNATLYIGQTAIASGAVGAATAGDGGGSYTGTGTITLTKSTDFNATLANIVLKIGNDSTTAATSRTLDGAEFDLGIKVSESDAVEGKFVMTDAQKTALQNALKATDQGFKLDGEATGYLNISYDKDNLAADGTTADPKWFITVDGKNRVAVSDATVANGVLTLMDDKGNNIGTVDMSAATTGAAKDATLNDFKRLFQGGANVVKLGKDPAVTGTLNSATQNIQVGASGGANQLANVTVDLTEYMQQDGNKITLGDTTYTVALGKDSKFKDAKNVIDLTDMSVKDKTFNADIAATRLTSAAKENNGTFSIGHGLADHAHYTTLQQLSSVKDSTDMSTREGIASYIKVEEAKAGSLENVSTVQGLTLQIGDTSDTYNQLAVSIGDMHVSALGIDAIDISTQKGAQDAVDVIRNAINQVSSVRGDLGATQNRLEHTANNLSVMAENIQDAESTIRDTDVAEEMMAYTKNNILIQSAQAMLAQANAVPQGVLQLLG